MQAKIFRGTVLVITGDAQLRNDLHPALLRAGYEIRMAQNQEDALMKLHVMLPTILIVDRREAGFSRLRREMPFLPPIVTVTYHPKPCDEHHTAMDLENGATRAVCNARPALIVALLGAVLRRERWERPRPTHYAADGITVDLETTDVTVGALPVNLSRTEFRILETLITAPGHYLSRKALLNRVWGEGFAILPHVLDVHISSLRRKLDPTRRTPELIMTVKGLGFKLRSTTPFAEIRLCQPRPSALPAIRPPAHNVHPTPTRSARMDMSRGARWQRRSAHPISVRYRGKLVASGPER